MESRFRYRLFPPDRVLEGVDRLAGHAVLEVGCGTGYFTIPAARMIGDHGSLVAIDIVADAVDLVSKKLQAVNLSNVRVVKTDALRTNFDGGRFDTVLLFGVIPAPMLPLARLLPEMHRLLRPNGNLAIWPPIPAWLPRSILKSHLFALASKRNHVYNFTRC
jgi:ubiquinone/menaquinone biosynthesis C-methylase UbiE